MERDPVRAISQTGVFVLFYLLIISFLAPPLGWAGGSLIQITLSPFFSAALTTLLCWKIYDEFPLPDAGLTLDRSGARDLLVGVLAGAIGVALILIPALVFHFSHFTTRAGGTKPTFASLLFFTVLIFCGAAGEEMLFHGYAFQSLVLGLGPFAAILPVGVLFGLLHMGNPDATWISTLNTIGFGIVFGYALCKTTSLWLPIGLHFGWNIALPLLGVNISGITMRLTGYEMAWSAGPVWSGGAYGPEGSVLTTAVLVLMAVFVWRYPFPRPVAEVSEPVSQPVAKPPESEPSA